MSGFNPFGGGTAAATNPNYTYEPIGFVANDGSGTVVTSGASNVQGSYTASMGTTANNWSGFIVTVGIASSASNRYILDISVNNGSSDLISLYLQPDSGRGYSSIRVPLQVASGAVIKCRCQSSAGSATIKVGITGLIANSANPPGFTTVTAIQAVDRTNTRPSTQSVTTNTSATNWTQLSASTAAQYGAFLIMLSENATPTSIQGLRASLGVGAAASEVAIGGGDFTTSTTTPLLAKGVLPLIEATVAASSRLSLNIQAAGASGADNFFVGLLAFS